MKSDVLKKIIIPAIYLAIFVIYAKPARAENAPIDTDADGLSDEQEISMYYTDPKKADTDEDGFLDGAEIIDGNSPHGANKKMHEYDYDNDGLNDLLELAFASNMGVKDTDGDGHTDYEEVMHGYNPRDTSPLATFARRVEVNLSKQKLFYIVDEKLVRQFPVSTGNPQTPTPPGNYEISRMLPVARYVARDYDLPNVQWNMQFRKGGYFIHGAYWHNDFGKKTRSHGCVNMRTADAGWLYQYMKAGVQVAITGKTPKNRLAEI